MPRQPQDEPGLQAERTRLSWEHSATGFLVSGAILLRQSGILAVGRTLLAVTAVLLALLVPRLGRRRGRRVRAIRLIIGKKIVSNARTEVLVIGWPTAAFATAVLRDPGRIALADRPGILPGPTA
jgi:putative membrane protein